ncbi:GGDEF domain-containing protein [Massilia putida]|uniref:GGDEF domain-containing protein n=1 Tax=Massilia putida TaxID=1141883 RepID=UPI000950C133|nr:GGDEF domain-containing protein [Massilia putida]
MDAFTLVVVSALASVVMAASMALLYRAAPHQTCLRDWALTGVFFTCNSVLAAFAFKFHLASFLVPGIANALYVAGHFGVLAGLRRHLGLVPGWPLMVAVVPLVLALHAVPALQASVAHRLLVFTPLIAAINLGVGLTLRGRIRPDEWPTYLPLVAMECVFMLQQSMRTIYLVASRDHALTFMGSQFFQTSGSLFLLLFLSVIPMSYALIVAHRQAQDLRRASLTDTLTGWLNRRALQNTADVAFSRCRRDGSGMFFIMFDIDHFKAINDRHGHGVGDAAIRHVTDCAGDVLHGHDALFRIGGEEFAVLLAGQRLHDVRGIAERLRERIAATPLRTEGLVVPMTVSVGVAAYSQHDEHWEAVLRRADEALYRAKVHGRNRVDVCNRAMAANVGT